MIDSDFDIDENQGVDQDDENDVEAKERALLAEERELYRKRNVYKDPKARNNNNFKSGTSVVSVDSVSNDSIEKKPQKRAGPGRPPGRKKTSISANQSNRDYVMKHYRSKFEHEDYEDDFMMMDEDGPSMSKNLRRSTQKSSKETRDLLDERRRLKERMKRKKLRRGKRHEYRQLTQDEMLREAKKTEIENLKSLEAYKNLEIEKVKKVKSKQVTPDVPMIRYHSYTEYEDNKKKANVCLCY